MISSIAIPDFLELAWRHSDWYWVSSSAVALFPGALENTRMLQSDNPQTMSPLSSIMRDQTEAGTESTWSHFPLSHTLTVLSSEPEKYFPAPKALHLNYDRTT